MEPLVRRRGHLPPARATLWHHLRLVAGHDGSRRTGVGVALAPPRMFARQLSSNQVVQPFDIHAALGSYWLTRLKSRKPSAAMANFANWLFEEVRLAYGSEV